MDLSELIRTGWPRHESESDAVADELEGAFDAVSEPTAVPYLQLATHTIGEHLNDWPRAASLAARVAGTSSQADAHLYALVAATAANRDANPHRARFLELTDAPNAADTRIEANVARALIGSGQTEAGIASLRAALRLAEALPEDDLPARELAITCNNIATDLIGTDKTPDQSDVQQLAAKRALEYWRIAGTWVNEERAFYLLALVALDQGQAESAEAYAREALAIIAANGTEDVDRAFLELTLAAALRRLERAEDARAHLDTADALAAGWEAGLKDWYLSERAKWA